MRGGRRLDDVRRRVRTGTASEYVVCGRVEVGPGAGGAGGGHLVQVGREHSGGAGRQVHTHEGEAEGHEWIALV